MVDKRKGPNWPTRQRKNAEKVLQIGLKPKKTKRSLHNGTIKYLLKMSVKLEINY